MALLPWWPTLAAPSPTTSLADWAAENRDTWKQALAEHGAVLFRNFAVPTAEHFAAVNRVVIPAPLNYVYRSTPRTEVGEGIYTATEYPPAAVIPQHCENAYQRDWPMLLSFYCAIAPPWGGETPLADNRRTTELIPEEVRERLSAKGVLYVRNYGHGIDLPWQVVFQTKERAAVEDFCRRSDIAWEWLPEDRLRTRQVCQGMARHPVTGETLWFNQAHLFHVSSLDAKTREAMLSLFKVEDLPRHAFYGDGSEFEPEVLEAIHRAHAEQATFTWKKGDVLLFDNMRVSHGRRPYRGPRKILVSMGEPYSEALQRHVATG